MNEPDQCIICLEVLPPGKVVVAATKTLTNLAIIDHDHSHPISANQRDHSAAPSRPFASSGIIVPIFNTGQNGATSDIAVGNHSSNSSSRSSNILGTSASASSAASASTSVGVDGDSDSTLVANLDTCHHTLHDSCVRSWARKSNTCPICRTEFFSVSVHNGVEGE
jgi:hypothetical protein